MAQVLKQEVRDRIVAAALRCFSRKGVAATTMSEIAEQAEVAVANLYRYYENKDALFAAVVPDELVATFDALLAKSAHAHSFVADGSAPRDLSAAGELLDFWLGHRHAVIVLLELSEGTPHERFAQRFVARLVDVSLDEIHARHPHVVIDREARLVLTQVFENTRRTIASILRSTRSDREARVAIAAFRSYQVAGLAALVQWIVDASASKRRELP